MKKTNRMLELFEEHIKKDAMLWNELKEILAMKELDEMEMTELSILPALIHDNNYMLITLISKMRDWKEPDDDIGNH